MSCPNKLESGAECGDEGRLCPDCADREYDYWKDQWLIAPLSERDPERYEQEMRDAGRGHLVKP